MKFNSQPRVAIPAFLLILVAGGCSSNSNTTVAGATTGGTSPSSGGASANGGSTAKGGSTGVGGTTTGVGGTQTGTGGAAVVACTATANVTPCGGNVVATWTVASGCLNVAGQLDMSPFGLGCTSAPVTGTLQVTGTFTANSNGMYTDNTTTTGSEQLALPAACLSISGTTTTCDRIGAPLGAIGYDSVTCTNAATGGGCTCTGIVKMSGGLGAVSSSASTTGSYATAANVLTTDSTTNYSYCVAGNKLTLTPTGTAAGTVTGTIVLQSGTTNGTGGAGAGGASTGGKAGTTGGAANAGGQPTGGKATTTGGVANAGGQPTGGKAATTGGVANAGGQSTGGASATGGAGNVGGSTAGEGPCDIYKAGSTPCVAAYSSTRVLLSTYTGPLYQVRKGGSWSAGSGMTGGTFQDIGSVAGGYADSAAQDTFCTGGTCTFSVLYDQSGKKNDLKVAPAGCYTGTASEPDSEANASHSLNLNGHKVYSVYIVAHNGYRNNSASGVPVGNVGQGIYEVADGKRIGAACCFDFGNAAPNNCNGGTMTALFFGTGYWGKGAGSGPWFLGDFEGGVWAGGTGASNAVISTNPSMAVPYAFGILNSGPGNYAIKAADAQSGSLITAYDGAQPKTLNNQGAVILGIGGDNSNSSLGTFFEGAMTSGRPTPATDAAVLANVQAAKYGQ